MRSSIKLLISVCGIYATFLIWGLTQEPLNTRVWQNSKSRFEQSCFISLIQALFAMCIGSIYLLSKKNIYGPLEFLCENFWYIVGISLSQSLSSPLANYSLHYVDYVSYMLAKSCKLLPIMLVHLLVYRTRISREKKVLALLVSFGVSLFSMSGKTYKGRDLVAENAVIGYLMLFLSLFVDGITNATQDKLFKRLNKKKITGAHLMFGQNLLVVLWHLLYMMFWNVYGWQDSIEQIKKDPEILNYLLVYSICGAVGQCFIFFMLENYNSIVLTMVTVTRKMISMLLSIVIYRHNVNLMQWIGILIVFGGISWEASSKWTV